MMKLLLIIWMVFASLPLSANISNPLSDERGGRGKVMPREQATHFCCLLMNDGESIMPLSVHARRVLEPSDSLSSEQLFVDFLMREDNWQTLRLFPHRQDDGNVVWYAPAEALPASMDAEHQKYIREVFPRLVTEIRAGHWSTVDAYIDRMIQYQCQFGGTQYPSRSSSAAVIGIIFLIFVLIILCNTKIYPYLCTRKQQE